MTNSFPYLKPALKYHIMTFLRTKEDFICFCVYFPPTVTRGYSPFGIFCSLSLFLLLSISKLLMIHHSVVDFCLLVFISSFSFPWCLSSFLNILLFWWYIVAFSPSFILLHCLDPLICFFQHSPQPFSTFLNSIVLPSKGIGSLQVDCIYLLLYFSWKNNEMEQHFV